MASHMAFAAATAAEASFFTGGRPGGGRGFSFPTLYSTGILGLGSRGDPCLEGTTKAKDSSSESSSPTDCIVGRVGGGRGLPPGGARGMAARAVGSWVMG